MKLKMIPPKKILFPVDFSDRCRGAARAVRAVAQRFKAEVTPVHVIETSTPENLPDDLLTRSRRAYEEIEKLLRTELLGRKVQPCVVTGDPAIRIVELADSGDFDLIMMPTHGYGAFRKFLLGSNTAKVLHDATCPVWTSAHLEDWPVIQDFSLSRVLCGIDFGPRSAVVLKSASEVASIFGARLNIAHVIPFVELPSWHREAEMDAKEKVRKIAVEQGISAPIHILDGSPASSLSEEAERLNADLMVIGRTHIADSAKIGSNAYAIIAHSPCPVLSI